MSRNTSVAPTNKALLPTGTPDQILKGALGLESQQWRVGTVARTVTETTAVADTAYDRQSRSLILALLSGLTQTDPALQATAQQFAVALNLDPEALRDSLQRQQAAWDGYHEAWAIRGGVRRGRRVVDGTRRLARSMVEADVERTRATLDDQGQKRLDDDLRDYEEAAQRDAAGKLAARALTQEITTAGQQQLGDFQNRRQLVNTLDSLAMNDELPWEVLVKAGATLDQLSSQQDTATTAPATKKRAQNRH